MSSPAHSIDASCGALSDFIEKLVSLGKTRGMESLATTELSFSEIRSLFVINASDTPMSVHEIGQAINLSLAASGRAVDRLVRHGLVDRREDSIDRRIKRVSLTEAGQALIDEQVDIRRDTLRDFLAGLPDAQRSALTAAIRPIIDADGDYFDLKLDHHCTTANAEKVPS